MSSYQKREVVPEQTKTVRVYVCDCCGAEYRQHRGNRCRICKRDVCGDCAVENPRYIGDYPDYYCTCCYAIYSKYQDKLYALENAYDEAVDATVQAWRDESLAAKPKEGV